MGMFGSRPRAAGSISATSGQVPGFAPYPVSQMPRTVAVDPSCAGLPAAKDPAIQGKALEILRRSVAGNPGGTAEWGFMASEPYVGSKAWIGQPFTEYKTHEISGDRITRERPTALENILTGYRPQSVFVHAHPNRNDRGEISKSDRDLGMPVIAIDTNGRMTCAY